ncbi:MAG: metallophosphoesterase family protein [Solitalea-like symbiont of Tyrophagus putrescentiae]
MIRIGLISDTHGFMDDKIASYLEPCDAIWHAGDIGSISVIEKLESLKKKLFIVHGNIDSHEIRSIAPKELIFHTEDVKVAITHIGGYPGKYTFEARNLIEKNRPNIFVCGHSHILKIIKDNNYNLMHLNPGAIGKSGYHKVRTIIRFSIDGKELKNIEIIEINR